MTKEQLEALDIRLFKLMNGDTIIASITKSSQHLVHVEIPLQLFEEWDNEDRHVYYFREWMPMNANASVAIAKGHVVGFCDIDPVVKQRYVDAVTAFSNPEYMDENDPFNELDEETFEGSESDVKNIRLH
jgi:hypothetical protein